MLRERFELALEQLPSEWWEHFERLASTFLVEEFPNLRTVAWPAGDKGRDAELWQPEDDLAVMLQYSVTEAWSTKIRDTAKRLGENFRKVNVLIYVTNQSIGPEADDLRTELRKAYKIALDIRDRRWFLDRQNHSPATEKAAARFAEIVVDPYLASKGVIESKAQALTDYETQVAFVYLHLQLADETKEKGLTRLCFESLIRATLRDTHSEQRMSRQGIRDRIYKLLPGHSSEEIDRHIDSALHRLSRRHVRHWKQSDEFCLSHEERQQLQGRLTVLATRDALLLEELKGALQGAAAKLKITLPQELAPVLGRLRRVLELVLLERGEWFASGLSAGRVKQLNHEEVKKIVIRDVGVKPEKGKLAGGVVPLVSSAVETVLTAPSSKVHEYLGGLSKAYTLLAFLRQTPDVQGAVVKMFSEGEIWLDTNIALPLFAEDLYERDDARQYTKLLKAAREAGLALKITHGVLEEIERQFNRASLYSSGTVPAWRGGVPFLASTFLWSGRNRNEFNRWMEKFRGVARPEEDIGEYLRENFEIEVSSLDEDRRRASDSLQAAVYSYWTKVHEARRGGGPEAQEIDPMAAARLVEHDTENFLGVIQRRRGEKPSPLGHKHWWLTLDRAAYAAAEEISREVGDRRLTSPVLSPDFLSNYLMVGPCRRLLSNRSEAALPLMMDMSVMDAIPPDLMDAADKLREELKELPENVRRRRVRDMLDAAKLRLGQMAQEGIAGVEERLRKEFLKEVGQKGQSVTLPNEKASDFGKE